jgi:hypothetical protein
MPDHPKITSVDAQTEAVDNPHDIVGHRAIGQPSDSATMKVLKDVTDCVACHQLPG